jgi:8-oxo-dGTP pyrophosphatase MutT (NUDIX family)
LLLVFPVDDLARVVLTVRAPTLGHHGGQISLPGGAVEEGETVEEAALREAREEIGLMTEGVRTLGRLTPVDVSVSGFRLHPIVATLADRPALTPCVREVARVLEVGVHELMDPRAFAWRTLERPGLRLEVPTVVIEGVEGRDELWGATAMVMAEFLTLLGWPGPPAT